MFGTPQLAFKKSVEIHLIEAASKIQDFGPDIATQNRHRSTTFSNYSIRPPSALEPALFKALFCEIGRGGDVKN